jgi:hypothetical protein
VSCYLLSLLSFACSFFLQPEEGGEDNSPCQTTSTMHTSPSGPRANPLLARSTDQTIREQSGCSDKKITRSLMKCANSWRWSVSSTNALINESVAKAKTSNTAGNVSTSVMSSSKAKEDIVDCHWCCFVFCFLVLLLELCRDATFAAVALCFFLADRDNA